MRTLLILALVVVVLVVARLSVYTVDAAEYAYVTILGRPVATYDGGGTGAGLYFGWPWPIQAVQRLDRRIQTFNLPPTEHLTPDADNKTVDKNLSVTASIVWRISDQEAVDRFVKYVGTVEQAQSLLTPRVISALNGSLGKMKMDDIISAEPGRVDDKMQAWQTALLAGLKDDVRQNFGIDVLDIRLRRFSYPDKTRDAIFDRIRSERRRKVTHYQEEGVQLAKEIEIAAEEKYRNTLTEARYQEERLKGEADTQALTIRNQAHSQEPEFYAFMKKMEKLQSILGDNRTVLLLSTHRPLFDMLFQPPRPGVQAPPAPPAGSPSSQAVKPGGK